MSVAYNTDDIFLHLDLFRIFHHFLALSRELWGTLLSVHFSCWTVSSVVRTEPGFAHLLLLQAHITISQQTLVDQANETAQLRNELRRNSESQRVCLSGRSQERTCISCFLLSNWTDLGLPCALWFNHDVDETRFTCVFQCLLQRVSELFWCLYKISSASKCSHYLLIMRVWQETHWRDTGKQL